MEMGKGRKGAQNTRTFALLGWDVNVAHQYSDQSVSADLNSSNQVGIVQSGSPRQNVDRNQGSGKPR